MNVSRLFATRFRLALDVVVLGAVIAAIVILIVTPGGHATDGPSAAQVTAAKHWLAATPLPAGARADRTDTACMVTVSLCVIADSSQRNLASGLRRSFEARGASVRAIGCGHRGPCLLAASRGDAAQVNVQISRLAGYRGAQSVAVIEVDGDPLTAASGQPVPAPASLLAVPMGGHVSLRCESRIAGGCTRFAGSVTYHGTLAVVAARWRAVLEEHGWLVFGNQPSPGGLRIRQPGEVAATRSLSVNGGRFVSVIAHLTQRGGTVVATVDLESV